MVVRQVNANLALTLIHRHNNTYLKFLFRIIDIFHEFLYQQFVLFLISEHFHSNFNATVYIMAKGPIPISELDRRQNESNLSILT